MTPTPWRVERGFGNSRIIAADGSIVAVDISQADAEAVVAALAVVEAAKDADSVASIGLGRTYEEGLRGVWMSGERDHAGIFSALRAALAAYDEATR